MSQCTPCTFVTFVRVYEFINTGDYFAFVRTYQFINAREYFGKHIFILTRLGCNSTLIVLHRLKFPSFLFSSRWFSKILPNPNESVHTVFISIFCQSIQISLTLMIHRCIVFSRRVENTLEKVHIYFNSGTLEWYLDDWTNKFVFRISFPDLETSAIVTF